MDSTWLQQLEEFVLGGADCVEALESLAASASGARAETARVAAALWTGEIERILATEFARALLAPFMSVKSREQLESLDLAAAVHGSATAWMAAAADAQVAQAQVLLLGVAALQHFMANNYTGPPAVSYPLFESWPSEVASCAQEWASSKLRLVSHAARGRCGGCKPASDAHHPRYISSLLCFGCGRMERMCTSTVIIRRRC